MVLSRNVGPASRVEKIPFSPSKISKVHNGGRQDGLDLVALSLTWLQAWEQEISLIGVLLERGLKAKMD